jgi:hypothetical protein
VGTIALGNGAGLCKRSSIKYGRAPYNNADEDIKAFHDAQRKLANAGRQYDQRRRRIMQHKPPRPVPPQP